MGLNIRLNSLIVGSGFILVLIIGAIGGVTVWSTIGLEKMNQVNSQTVKAALESKYHIVQIQQFMTDASLTGEMDSVKEAGENLKNLESTLDSIEKLSPEFNEQAEKVRSSARKMAEVGLEMTSAYLEHGKVAGDAIMKRPETGLDAMAETLSKAMETLAVEANKKEERGASDLSAAQHKLRVNTSGLLFFELIMVVAILGVVYARIRPLTKIISRIEENSSNLEGVSREVAGTAETLFSVSEKQVEAVQETSASLEEIRAMSEKTAKNSDFLKHNIAQASENVDEGKKALAVVVETIEQIDSGNQSIVNSVEESNRHMTEIISVISEISEKTKVINDIVFQTKLLSFNASVEAARAGEYGKGFAVVAEEIGSLASMSGSSASEISTMLETGVRKVQEIVNNSKTSLESVIRDSRSRIQNSKEAASTCRTSFEKIFEKVGEVNSIVVEISSAISEQAKGLDEIRGAVSEIAKSTQTNSEASAVAESTGKNLVHQVEDLTNTVIDIEKVMNGNGSEARRAS